MDDNEFDFNVGQNGNMDDLQGVQDINLVETNTNDKENTDTDNNKNDFNNNEASGQIQEKPLSSGLVNLPEEKVENPNQEIDITVETNEITKSTLDEPISTTLKRDLYAIFHKIKYVAIPKMNEKKLEELYNWDLWGPLLFCFLYSIALSTGDNTNNESSIFVLIFIIFWIGGFVITFNGRFLGAKVGLCQMISLLGYGMFPITVGGIIIGFCRIRTIWIKLIIVVVAFVWSCFASAGFLGGLVEPSKKFIATYPVIIFMFSLSMFALNY